MTGTGKTLRLSNDSKSKYIKHQKIQEALERQF